MANDSPAQILYDNLGHPIGVILDGAIYRLQTQSTITDGTNTVAVKNASTAAIATDKALVVAVSPNNTIPISDAGGSLTVDGTVTSNIGTTNGLALDTTLTSGTTKAQMYDGANTIGTSAHPVRMDPTGTTIQPVTQTANIDAGNSRITALTGGETFLGTSIDVSNYGAIVVFVFADQAGTLNIEFSTNNSNWDNTIPYTISASKSEHVQIGPQARYFRVRYVNGSTPQSTFRLQTIEKPITAYAPVVPISSIVDPSGDAILTKSVISGKDGGNNYVDAQVNQFGDLSVSLSDINVSAFGRLRTAEALSLFASKQVTDSQPLYWDDQQTSGSGTASTYLTNKASTQISVTGNAAGTRVRQSFRRMNYQPAKSQLVILTGVLINEGGIGVAAANRRVGLFDDKNGFFFELTGTTLNVVMRSFATGSAVNTYVAQGSWNIDKLDGTGASGITLNLANVQIFVIDFQWLGSGRIRYGFDINGILHYCHEILIANTQGVVSISTPNLPIRYEIQSLGNGTASIASMQHICSTVLSEGGQQDIGFTFGVDMGATELVTGNDTNIYTLLAIQLQNTKLGAEIHPSFFTVASVTASTQYKVMLILNPTVAGTALSYTPVTNSAAQYAVGVANNLITGGTVVYSGYFQSNKATNVSDQLTIDIGLGSNIAGVSDTLVLAVQPAPTPGNAVRFLGSLNWKEQT